MLEYYVSGFDSHYRKHPQTNNKGDIVEIVITDVVDNDKKIEAIKNVKDITGLGLKEAKELVESVIDVESFYDSLTRKYERREVIPSVKTVHTNLSREAVQEKATNLIVEFNGPFEEIASFLKMFRKDLTVGELLYHIDNMG